MTLPLSVLDLVPVPAGTTAGDALRNSIELAQLAESLGYTRYWIAEHHNTAAFASSATELVIQMVARETERIRVGSGGIMLPNHSPLRIAENFLDRKSTRLNSSHVAISYAVFCLKKKKTNKK